jgi:hypothetical protein
MANDEETELLYAIDDKCGSQGKGLTMHERKFVSSLFRRRTMNKPVATEKQMEWLRDIRRRVCRECD